MVDETILCACGCGQPVTIYRYNPREFISGHNSRTERSAGQFTSERTKGSNNINWKGGVTPRHDMIRKSKRYSEWRHKIYEQDNWECIECGSKENIIAHHVLSFADYPELRFDLDNGVTMCRSCHIKLHKMDGTL